MGKGTHGILFDDAAWGKIMTRARIRGHKRVSDYVEGIMVIAVQLEDAGLDPCAIMKNALPNERRNQNGSKRRP